MLERDYISFCEMPTKYELPSADNRHRLQICSRDSREETTGVDPLALKWAYCGALIHTDGGTGTAEWSTIKVDDG